MELTRRFGHRKVTRKEVEEAGIRIPYSTLALLNQTAPDVSEHCVDDLTVQTTASTESAKKSNGMFRLNRVHALASCVLYVEE